MGRLVISRVLNPARLLCALGLVAVVALTAAPAEGTNLILNGSFENWQMSGVGLPNLYETMLPGGNTLPYWTVTDYGVDIVYSPTPGNVNLWQASDGLFSIDLNAERWGGIEQAFSVTVGHTYQVAFDLAGNWMNPWSEAQHILRVTVGNVGPLLFSFDSTGRSATDMGWVRTSFTFVAGQSGTTGLRFEGDPANVAAGPALDNVIVEDITPVPEPASLLLVGTGLAGLRTLRGRRGRHPRR